jgi:signal transduction histidine kinase
MEVLYETEKKEAQILSLAKEQRLYFWLLVAAVGIVLMLIVLFVYRHVAHRRQKALLAAKVALQTETKERHILARELHDSLGGMLSLLRIKSLATTPAPIGEGSEYLKLLDATIEELRRVAHHLMPEELLQRGLVSALHDFARSVPGAVFQTYGDIRLNKEQELTLYRCAYELVNNALKHADASHIDIQLMQDSHEVTLTVSDDGKGMEGCPTEPGIGHQNIRERISRFGGRLDITSTNGTEINVSIPL